MRSHVHSLQGDPDFQTLYLGLHVHRLQGEPSSSELLAVVTHPVSRVTPTAGPVLVVIRPQTSG